MRIALIGVPMDLGADRSGVDMGPSAIRYTGIVARLRELGHEVTDFGNVPVNDASAYTVGNTKLKYLDPIVEASQQLSDLVCQRAKAGYVPLILGGDNAISLGSISGVANALGPIGVLWLDAHGDFNDEHTTPSGNIHGMILAAMAGIGDERLTSVGGPGPHVDPKRIVIVGARDLDAGERGLLREHGVHVRTIADIDRRGMNDIMHEALEIAGSGTNGLHIMLDMDAVDPTEAPGVGTPVHGGMTFREAHLAMELIAESGLLRSLDVVEVNPILDEHNRTAELATHLALSALGKRIY